MDNSLNLDVNADDLRRVFGMLTGYVLLPESNHGYVEEFETLELGGRVRALAAGRELWHLLTASAARSGALDVEAESRRIAHDDFAMLPAALDLAHALEEEMTVTGGTTIGMGLVVQIADSTRALGALAYFLRAGRIAVHADAEQRGVGVDELLASLGQRLATA